MKAVMHYYMNKRCVMIYYFSGTGNSQWVAEQLAQRTKDTALFIPQVMKEMQKDITFGPEDTVGVVFPIYAWAAPEIVMQFLQHVHVDERTFTFAICTCGSEAGRAFDQFKTVFPLKSAYSISMPDNCITMFDSERPELIREKLNVAQQRMPIIAMNISTKSPTFEIDEGSGASFKTSIINPLFALAMMTPRHFSVDKSCTSCGLCERSCPFGTIKLVDGKPVWNGRCQQCMSCIMRCPVQAIQSGSATRKRRRYVNPNAGKMPTVQRENAMHLDNENISHANEATLSRENTVRPVGATFGQTAPSTQQVHHGLLSEASAVASGTSSFASGTASSVEFIPQQDIQVLSKLGLISRQLITPLNSKSSRVTITEVHMQLGAIQERHTHESSEQIWYALRGTGTLLLENNMERPFAAGDVVRFPENAVHGIKNTGTDEFIYLSVTTPPVDFTGAYSH